MKGLSACLLLALVCVTTGVAAADGGTPMFSFGGFGTLGVVHSDADKADFTSSAASPSGAGYSRSWSPAVDSLIGAQVTARLAPKLTAVLQVVSQQNYDNSFTPHIEWANLKYQFTPDFSVRAGQTELPNFLEAGSRKVGYTNPWVRPPLELYALVSVTSNIGVDTSLRMHWGTASNTLQAILGQADYKFPGYGASSEHAKSRKQMALVDKWERGFMTVQLNYGQARVTIPELAPLFDAFRQFGPMGSGIADRYDVNDRIISFFGVGASYDPGDWFVLGEWGRVIAHSIVGNKTGWYLSAGRRIRTLTPYITYGEVRADSSTTDPGLTVAGLPPYAAAAANQLNGYLNSILGLVAVQKTISVGTRWDFTQNFDLKIQYDRLRPGAGSPGTLNNLQPGFVRGSGVNVISATLDFVF